MIYILMGSFGGSSRTAVGVYEDWDRMLADVSRGYDDEGEPISEEAQDEPERFSVYQLTSLNEISRDEEHSDRELWDSKSIPAWQTKDGSRPKSWDDLSD